MSRVSALSIPLRGVVLTHAAQQPDAQKHERCSNEKTGASDIWGNPGIMLVTLWPISTI